MVWVRSAAAFMSIALLTVVAALPWGLPAEDRFFLPLLPAVAIYLWGLRTPDLIPEWLVFLVGLSLDILTNGPLGYWALIYLIAQVMAAFSPPPSRFGAFGSAGLIASFLLALALIAWLISSVYFLEFADWRPYLTGALFAGVGAILLHAIFKAFDGAVTGDGGARVVRGT